MDPKNVTFIVPIYGLKEHRIKNLKFILPHLKKTGCRILVVEQTSDEKSNVAELLKSYEGVEHLFFKTDETRFHKTGIINWTVFTHVTTKYAWVNDADFYMRFSEMFQVEWAKKFIQPYSSAKKLTEVETNIIQSGNSLNVKYDDTEAEYISMYAAMSFIFHVKSFKKLNGMDQTLYGWGKEDGEFYSRVKQKYSIQQVDIKGIHFYHPIQDESDKKVNINEYFDRIYCVNLKDRKNRWERVSKEFIKHNISVERVDAVPQSEITDEEFKNVNPHNIQWKLASDFGIIENKGAFGCLKSHLKIIKDAKQKEYKKILIFEDDVLFANNFLDELAKLKNLKWKLLYLGASQFTKDGIRTIDNFYLAKKTYGTFAYAIDCSVYDEIISALETPKKSIDNILIEFQKKWEGECYVFSPNIVISTVEESDIREKNNTVKYANIVGWNLENFPSVLESKPRINFDDGLKNLIELDRLFLKNGIKYWLSCGTLLGFYRDNAFITHDKDIDVCVNSKHLTKSLLFEFIKNDFKIIKHYGKLNDGFQLALKKRGIKIDIFFYYEKDGWGYHSVYSDFEENSYLKHDYIFSKFELEDREFFGYNFVVPKDIEKHLIEQYGENFRIKDKNWKYEFSPKNIMHTGVRVNAEEAKSEFEIFFCAELIDKVTLLIKSFDRKDCVDILIDSIRRRYKNIKIIVVDDSKPELTFSYDKNIKTYNIPFDSGLSAGRNYGVSKIDTEYFVLLDDDFEFTDDTDLLLWFDIMKKSNLDILGGHVILNGETTDFFGKLQREGNTLYYKTEFYSVHKDYKTCDLVLNFFMAKTEKIKECKWDESLKLSEHTAYFYRHKNELKIGYTDKIAINHKPIRTKNYTTYRGRAHQYLKSWMASEKIAKIIGFNSILGMVDGEFRSNQMNKTYWNNFYTWNSAPTHESDFSRFVLKYISEKIKNPKLVDAGCGNGRDLIYFLNNKIDATGIDACSSILNEYIKKEDITKFDYSEYNVIYLRFVIHAMYEEELDTLLDRIKLTAKNSLIFIETRSTKGITSEEKMLVSFISTIGEEHSRMLYSQKYLYEKFKKYFKIIYVQESNGFAKFNTEDPICIRYILET